MSRKEKRMLVRIGASIVLFCLASWIPVDGWGRLLIHLLPYGVAGWDILWRSLRNIRSGQIFDENLLMSIATIGAFILGDYPEATFVMLFYQVGEWFQRYAVGKSRRSIADLMDIRPDYANLWVDGQLEEVDPQRVAPGDLILVRPGERVPLDGVVLTGESTLDTAALTGESLPRSVKTGDQVISGCINQQGLLTLKVTKAFEESTVSRILDLVENAASRKARTENFITRFARYYTPTVVALAAALAVIPSLIDGQWARWCERALIFLVISCPCALVISVPLSFFGGVGGASRQGILVKGANYLEALAQVKTVVFDKTGTLTQGGFKVRQIHPVGISKEALLEKAALAESYSAHPIALSLRTAWNHEIDLGRVQEAQEKAGLGVVAQVDGMQVQVGSRQWMEQLGLLSVQPASDASEVHVAVDGVYAGYLVISDEIKPDAPAAIKSLKARGIDRCVMLTGDSCGAVEAVAQRLGMDEYFYGLLPDGKVRKMEEILSHSSDKVAFVGDGINDAPVLTRADVGIAMGGLGSDAAIEAADIVLMDDQPSKLVTAISIAQKTRRIVRQNILFALGVKGLVLILGAMGLASMWAATFADVGVSVIAILNAMRAMKAK